jgi:ABC-type amino acid transport/signal transduction systems, periplasmic component/domain
VNRLASCWLSWVLLSIPALGISSEVGSEAPLELTADERAFLQAHPVIRVSNERDWPPYDYFEHGRPQGYSVDLMQLLSARIGVTFEFVQGKSWEELVERLCARQIDVLHAADRPQRLLECANFSVPIIRGVNQFLTRRDHPEVRSIADLFGSVAASPRGWEQTELLKRRFGDRFRIIETTNLQEAIALVAQCEADFTTDFTNVLNYHLARLGYVGLRVQGVWSREDKGGELAALYVATRNDWPILQSILDQALAALTPDQIRHLQGALVRCRRSLYSGRALTRPARPPPAQGPAQVVRRSRLDAHRAHQRGGAP